VRYRVLFKLSYRQKIFADCTVRTVADMAGPYNDVAGPYADMVGLSWWTVGSWAVESFLDTWHVFATWHHFLIGHSKLYGVHGDRTPDLPPCWSAFTQRGLPIAHALVLVI
jgi:hypothetical protein